MRSFLVAALCTVASTASAPAIHAKHFLFGMPTGAAATNDLIIRESYTLSNNGTTKFADWVAYKLTPHDVMGSLDLVRDFMNDPFLDPAETLEANPDSQDDYDDPAALVDYDRGHLAPLASFAGSRYASQVNYYSNIVPQREGLNRGAWGDLEQHVRDFVCTGLDVWVITGPVFEAAMTALPEADETHTVPSHFYKIVATRDVQPMFVAAFVMSQHLPRSADVDQQLVSVQEVEQRTGFDFFPDLTLAQSTALEQTALTATAWQDVVAPRCVSRRP